MADPGFSAEPSDRRIVARLRSLSAGARRALSILGETVVPPVCLGCHQPLASHHALCVDCWRGVDFIRTPLCDRLGLPMPFDAGGVVVSAAALADPPDYGRARAVGRYDGTLRRLVHDFKFHDRVEVCRLLAIWMRHAGAELLSDADIIVPVPLGRRRLLWRRFNQAAMLAGELARGTPLSFEPMVLVRTRATKSQVGLARAERRQNVRGAFLVPPALVPVVAGRRVVLVDDIITTGATAGAAARGLLRAGAARVDVLAVALVTDAALVTA
ncbi:MAG: ComF family protein [Hyphomicrobium sp.]